jgi:hypothetical protein
MSESHPGADRTVDEYLSERTENLALARGRFDVYMRGETLGSTKMLALADLAKQHSIASGIERSEKEREERERIGEKTITTFSDIVISAASLAAISETIRSRVFGQDGVAYSAAREEASGIVYDYAEAICKTDRALTLNEGMPVGTEILMTDIKKHFGIPLGMPI